jgi:hypothetical protein
LLFAFDRTRPSHKAKSLAADFDAGRVDYSILLV